MTTRPPDNRCAFRMTKGRCRLPCAEGHAFLCLKHWRAEYELDDEAHLHPDAAALVSKILGARDSLKTATDVNDVLTKVLCLRARKLLSVRDATLFAYICQLTLITLPGVSQQFHRLYTAQAWNELIELAINNAAVKLPPVRLQSSSRGKNKSVLEIS